MPLVAPNLPNWVLLPTGVLPEGIRRLLRFPRRPPSPLPLRVNWITMMQKGRFKLCDTSKLLYDAFVLWYLRMTGKDNMLATKSSLVLQPVVCLSMGEVLVLQISVTERVAKEAKRLQLPSEG